MRFAILIVAALIAGTAAGAQTNLPFGGFSHDNSQPVEIAADSLEVDQGAGTVVFAGNVRVGQGTLTLSADRIVVVYSGEASSGTVQRMEASGNVVLTNGAEAAEAAEAVYSVATGAVEMTGEVLLTQGQNALSGERLAIDLSTGTARMEGGVRSILRPETGQ